MAARSPEPAKRCERPQSLSASAAGRRRVSISASTSMAADRRAPGVMVLSCAGSGAFARLAVMRLAQAVLGWAEALQMRAHCRARRTDRDTAPGILFAIEQDRAIRDKRHSGEPCDPYCSPSLLVSGALSSRSGCADFPRPVLHGRASLVVV